MGKRASSEGLVSDEKFERYGSMGLEMFSRSIDLQEQASQEIPESTSSNYRGSGAYAPYPMVYMQEGNGAELTDVDGNSFIDFHAGVSAIINGHSPSKQVEAVKRQVEQGPYFATSFEREHETAHLMNELVPGADLTKFISTGTEAIMSALRLARAYTGKEKVLKFEGMYHGHTDYAMVNVHPNVENLGTRRNPTKIPDTTGVPSETMRTVESIPWNDVELLQEKLERDGDDIAAVMTEALMSNSGLLWPEDGYLDELRRLTREHDVLLILDEVVTGFRMGLHGAQGYFDIEPDLSVFGKAMANGYPCAALCGREEVMRFLESGTDKSTFMGTFSGNPLVVTAAHANLEILQEIGEGGYETLYERGERLTSGLREILGDAGHDVFVPKFAGFFAVHFLDGGGDPSHWREYRDIGPHTDPAAYSRFAAAMMGEGIFLPPKTGRINLMHAHTDAHIDAALEAAKVASEHV